MENCNERFTVISIGMDSEGRAIQLSAYNEQTWNRLLRGLSTSVLTVSMGGDPVNNVGNLLQFLETLVVQNTSQYLISLVATYARCPLSCHHKCQQAEPDSIFPIISH